MLQGRLRCGRCGRIMQVGYSGVGGNVARYLCARGKHLYGAAQTCQRLGGVRLEQRVLAEVFKVLEPAALAATAKALTEAEAHHRQRLAAFELAVARATFEADRARRQFDAVEPENRLVARTLERTWEQRLADQRRAEADLAAQRARRPAALSAEELAWLSRAGADVRAVFEAPTTTARERKQLLRTLITEVVVTVAEDRSASLRIVWDGGETTELTMRLNKTGGHFRTTDEDTVELVRRLAEHYDDRTIALILSRQGRRTGTGLAFTQARVRTLRTSRGIAPHTPAVNVTPVDDDAVVVNVREAAAMLQVSTFTVHRWLREGFIVGEQLTPGAPWRIRIDDAVRAKVVPDVPEGWLGLDEAAEALGVARQTVLHKVQRGELAAVHVNRGKRRGLRIQVERVDVGLFDQPR